MGGGGEGWKGEEWKGGQLTPDKHQRSPTSYTALCNGVVSHGAQFGGLWIFADLACKKQMQNQCVHDLCTMRCFTHVLSSHSDNSRCSDICT